MIKAGQLVKIGNESGYPSNPSLYKDKEEFDIFFWNGLVPSRRIDSWIKTGTIVMVIKEIVWDGQNVVKILHNGKVFYIGAFEIQPIMGP